MKEESAIIHLGKYLTREEIEDILYHIKSRRLLYVNRPYMFSEQIGGYPLNYAYQKSPELRSIALRLEQSLLSANQLINTRIIERGIGISTENIYIENISDKKELDTITRQVRIPLAGISKINNELLGHGLAYIVDTISGYNFSADKNSIHLVFNFLSNNETLKPWDLWKDRK